MERNAVLTRPISYSHVAVAILLSAGLVFLATVNLKTTPPLYGDEGWTLSVARNWVERGYYGRLLTGRPAPPGLEAAISVTGPVALSFYLFGVGITQGRLVGVVFMLAALATLYYLARCLYDRPHALGVLGVLFFLSTIPQFHPLFMGRTILAEMPMLFYLLSGYVCFLLSYRISPWYLFPTVGLWGIALITKLQLVPFWTIGLTLPLTIVLWKQEWGIGRLLATALVGSFLVYWGLLWLEPVVLAGHTLPKIQLRGLYAHTVIVPLISNRLEALKVCLTFGLPTLIGLIYALHHFVRKPPSTFREIVLLSLLSLSGSWFAWYLLLSVGWTRYLFPATFLGSIFFAALLYDLTDGFDWRSTFRRAALAFRLWNPRWTNFASALAIVLIAACFSITLKSLYYLYFVFPDDSVQQVAAFLNSQTPPNALIETYESELHFLLNRRYHFPSDQVIADLDPLYPGTRMDNQYDPLPADPDYLVTGGVGGGSGLYQAALESGAFRFLRKYGVYAIYERVR